MFTANPFNDLLTTLTPAVMQVYVILMFVAVIGGTIIDVIHKKSAKYFFENSQRAQKSAKRSVTGGEKISLAISTLTNETKESFDRSGQAIADAYSGGGG